MHAWHRSGSLGIFKKSGLNSPAAPRAESVGPRQVTGKAGKSEHVSSLFLWQVPWELVCACPHPCKDASTVSGADSTLRETKGILAEAGDLGSSEDLGRLVSPKAPSARTRSSGSS